MRLRAAFKREHSIHSRLGGMSTESPARAKDLSLKRSFQQGHIDFEDFETLLVKNAKKRAADCKDSMGKVRCFCPPFAHLLTRFAFGEHKVT